MQEFEILKRPGLPDLAYVYTPPQGAGAAYPVVMYLGGYASDMNGTKACFLESRARERGQGFLRFDYSGHGQSGGAFDDGTIGAWLADAADIFDHVMRGPAVLVGSSMGGWISLLLGRMRAGLVQGILGLAAAPDFTQGFYESLSALQKEELAARGVVRVGEETGHVYVVTMALLEDGARNSILGAKQNAEFPIRLVHGLQDAQVPWQTAQKIIACYAGGDIEALFIDDGDHRLGRPEDLEIIDWELRKLCGYF